MKKLKLSRSKAVRESRKLWRYAAEHGHKPEWAKEYNQVSCPLCAYGAQPAFEDINKCSICPFDWPLTVNNDKCCVEVSSNSGLFSMWCRECNPKRKIKIALQIANLPLRKIQEVER